MPGPQEQFKRLARVIANPSTLHPPAVTSGCWITAKELHGHPLTLDRMDRVGAIDPADRAALETDARIRRIRKAVRERAAELGHAGPDPLVLPPEAPTVPARRSSPDGR